MGEHSAIEWTHHTQQATEIVGSTEAAAVRSLAKHSMRRGRRPVLEIVGTGTMEPHDERREPLLTSEDLMAPTASPETEAAAPTTEPEEPFVAHPSGCGHSIAESELAAGLPCAHCQAAARLNGTADSTNHEGQTPGAEGWKEHRNRKRRGRTDQPAPEAEAA